MTTPHRITRDSTTFFPRARRVRPLWVGALLLVSVALMVPEARAQRREAGGDPAKMAERMTKEMAKRLELTEAQAGQVRPIVVAFVSQGQALRQRYGRADRETLRGEMMKLQEATDRQIAALLTEAQAERYRAFRAEQESRRGGRAGRGGRRGQ